MYVGFYNHTVYSLCAFSPRDLHCLSSQIRLDETFLSSEHSLTAPTLYPIFFNQVAYASLASHKSQPHMFHACPALSTTATAQRSRVPASLGHDYRAKFSASLVFKYFSEVSSFFSPSLPHLPLPCHHSCTPHQRH
jgi:hypothetical protein